jgi:predicted flavoprotein YhiN
MTAAAEPIAVVGAGAAGLMAAHLRRRNGARWSSWSPPADGGRKILISGGGRCNVLPSRLDPRQYTTASSPTRSATSSGPGRWTSSVASSRWSWDLPLALEPETGKLFPVSNRARDVRDRLVAEARERGASVRFRARVTSLAPSGAGGGWDLTMADGTGLQASAVVMATGGLSVPATGSDGAGLRIVSRLGHTVHDLYPALTPLTASPPDTPTWRACQSPWP